MRLTCLSKSSVNGLCIPSNVWPLLLITKHKTKNKILVNFFILFLESNDLMIVKQIFIHWCFSTNEYKYLNEFNIWSKIEFNTLIIIYYIFMYNHSNQGQTIINYYNFWFVWLEEKKWKERKIQKSKNKFRLNLILNLFIYFSVFLFSHFRFYQTKILS
jgi:hypothetical protein